MTSPKIATARQHRKIEELVWVKESANKKSKLSHEDID